MRKTLNSALLLLACFVISSCLDDEMDTHPAMVRDSQTDMEILSRFVDIDESTNQYYINENKKMRGISYINDADRKELEKVSPVNYEKYINILAELNNRVAISISDPKVAYVVLSANGKTRVKKVKEDVNFGFELSPNNVSVFSTRALPNSLAICGGRSTATGLFRDTSRTINMTVSLSPSIQYNYYYFDISSSDATPSPGITTPQSVVFSGTGSLFGNCFVWTAYWDAQRGTDRLLKWEFKGRGNSPSYGDIATCSFSY